ncbi:MAG: hypothetical protein OQL08_08830 [Gammaproteobacteria bacterium]|nr:hypothetical protein [Gammaproteobacteria bacterium]
MFGVSRKTADSAGGLLLAGGQDFVRVDGLDVVLQGDPVQGHGEGEHAGPVMAEGSSFVRISGVAVCRAGHLASCGHASTGSDYVRLSE